jgi:hypothetical protein
MKWFMDKDWFTFYVRFDFRVLRMAVLCLVGRHAWMDHRELGKRCVQCGHWKSPKESKTWLSIAEARLKSAGLL